MAFAVGLCRALASQRSLLPDESVSPLLSQQAPPACWRPNRADLRGRVWSAVQSSRFFGERVKTPIFQARTQQPIVQPGVVCEQGGSLRGAKGASDEDLLELLEYEEDEFDEDDEGASIPQRPARNSRSAAGSKDSPKRARGRQLGKGRRVYTNEVKSVRSYCVATSFKMRALLSYLQQQEDMPIRVYRDVIYARRFTGVGGGRGGRVLLPLRRDRLLGPPPLPGAAPPRRDPRVRRGAGAAGAAGLDGVHVRRHHPHPQRRDRAAAEPVPLRGLARQQRVGGARVGEGRAPEAQPLARDGPEREADCVRGQGPVHHPQDPLHPPGDGTDGQDQADEQGDAPAGGGDPLRAALDQPALGHPRRPRVLLGVHGAGAGVRDHGAVPGRGEARRGPQPPPRHRPRALRPAEHGAEPQVLLPPRVDHHHPHRHRGHPLLLQGRLPHPLAPSILRAGPAPALPPAGALSAPFELPPVAPEPTVVLSSRRTPFVEPVLAPMRPGPPDLLSRPAS